MSPDWRPPKPRWRGPLLVVLAILVLALAGTFIAGVMLTWLQVLLLVLIAVAVLVLVLKEIP